MLPKLLLPKNTNLMLEIVHIETKKITVTTRTNRKAYTYPECGAVSHRVHSRYRRTIANLAGNHKQVTHSVQVHRFFFVTISIADIGHSLKS